MKTIWSTIQSRFVLKTLFACLIWGIAIALMTIATYSYFLNQNNQEFRTELKQIMAQSATAPVTEVEARIADHLRKYQDQTRALTQAIIGLNILMSLGFFYVFVRNLFKLIIQLKTVANKNCGG